MTQYANLAHTVPLDYALWHRRFGHLNLQDIKSIFKQQLVLGAKLNSDTLPDPICEPCLAGKQTRANVPKSVNSRRSGLLELIHSDLHGPLSVQTRIGAYHYWITFTDNTSRYWTVAPLKHKSDTFAIFKVFKALTENQLNARIKALYNNNKSKKYMFKKWEKL